MRRELTVPMRQTPVMQQTTLTRRNPPMQRRIPKRRRPSLWKLASMLTPSWIWEQVPNSQLTNKIVCPPVAQHATAVSAGLNREVRNPYQKPTPLYAEILTRFSREMDVVVEWTAGSGTIGAAVNTFSLKRFGTEDCTNCFL